MRRNKGWLAVLAISVVLPILRHGSTGERLPLNHGNTELRANRSKAAYNSRGSNRAAHILQNALPYQESSTANVKSALPVTKATGNAISSDETGSVSSEIAGVFIERSSSKNFSFFRKESRFQNPQERTGKFATRTRISDKNRESRNSRLPRASGGAIKSRLRRREEQTPEDDESGALGGNQLVRFGYHPYYGHVDGNFRDDDPLKTSERSKGETDGSEDKFLREKLNTEQAAGSSRETIEKGSSDEQPDIESVPLLTDHHPDNELANSTVVLNEQLKESREESQELISRKLKLKNKPDDRSVYSLMNNEHSIDGSINVTGPNEVSKESHILFDYESSNQTTHKDDFSNFESFQLTSNKSTGTEDPLGDEILLKRGSTMNRNARRDNSIFFTDPELPSAFTKPNTREYTSPAGTGSLISTRDVLYPNSSYYDRVDSSQKRAINITQETINNFDNETSDHEGESISSDDIVDPNLSNFNQEKIGGNFVNETRVYERNNVEELDFTFDEENAINDSVSDALNSNYGGSWTTSLMSGTEDGSNNATRRRLNERDKDDEFQSAQHDGSAFKDTTKESKTFFAISPLESLGRDPTHPSSKKNFNEENNRLSENSSETFQSAKEWQDSMKSSKANIRTSLETPKINQETWFDDRSTLTRPPDSSVDDIFRDAENYEGRSAAKFNKSLNGSVIVSKDETGVWGINEAPVLSSNQNNVGEIKDNEPDSGLRWKNDRKKLAEDGSGDNGTPNRINPGRKEEKAIERARSMDPGVSNGVIASWIEQRFQTGRRSRSSELTSTLSTLSGLGFNSSKVKGKTQFGSGNENPRNGTNNARIDSVEPVLESSLQTPMVSLDHPELVLDRQDRLFVSGNLVLTTDDPGRSSNREAVTFPTTELETMPVDIDPSIPSTSTDNGQRSFVSDVNSSSGEELMNAEDGSYKANNSSVELEPLDQWPVKHSAVVEGDLVLGGLMMVHEREDTITCGPVMPQGGVQALEAMLYTLDRLNDQEIVPGVKIGAHILDDCDKDTYGLEMAVDFIKGSISNIDGAEYSCNKTAVRKVISGVVGAASSVTSIQVANLLRLFRIPQVSFFSTSPELSNKQRFEYFTRTIPSDHYQVKAMVDIVLKMGWSYVSIIYEESNYGIKAFEELEELLGKHNICIANKEKLVKDSGVAEETAYDNIVLKLLTKPRARGCIIFGSDQEVAGVMRAVRRRNATDTFSWIGSDGWSARGLVSNGNEPEVEGTLSVQPQANPVKGFQEYFLNLTVENNRRNPWFVEFWEDHFQCRYPNASKTPYNQKYTKPCTTKERLTKQNTAFEDQLQFVSDAVMAFAYAFRDMHRDLCHGKPGLCDAMKPTKGTELLKYLRKVDFEGLSGDKFKFDKNGDGPARYNIIHFKQTEPGKYKWIRVGKYLEGELRLNMSEIQFKLGHPQPPESVCSLPCEVGQAKKYVEGERCCWHCFNCTQYQIRHPKDETQCIPCRQGTVPDETHSTCRDIPEEFLRPESGWAIGAMSFSATGIMITLFVGGVFLKHNDTPVVRASGRELSYVLLSGILLCYLVTFALVLRPTDIVCGIQRFTAGFCFTVVYAALLTKTNRISRIFNASKHSAKRPSFISPRSQLIICSGLMFVQILINGVWMIIDPARAMHHYPTREDNLLVCNSYVDASYMIAFAYPIMLIVVCTVYAVLTRKIPEAFNESKHIGFTMYTTCVIWLAFVPLYFGTGNNVALRITSMSVTISLSASVTIACLFSPKLYIILIRPERNVRQSMMPARYSTTKSSAVTATNASSMIAPITLTAATCDQNKAVKKHIITTIDCSTQSEYYELEVKDRKNGKPPPTVVSRSTQTSGNEKDSNAIVSSKDPNENTETTKQLNNNARIGNGPVNQSDVPL